MSGTFGTRFEDFFALTASQGKLAGNFSGQHLLEIDAQSFEGLLNLTTVDL